MGKYINRLPNGEPLPKKNKIGWLITHADATITNGDTFQENLVCVVDCGNFDAAAWAYDEREYLYLKRGFDMGTDPRNHYWLIVPNVEQLVQ